MEPARRARAARLVTAREYAGYGSAAKAAKAFNWPESSYRAHENGSRGIGADDADRYAKAFAVSREWLLNARGAMSDSVPPKNATTPAPNAFAPVEPVTQIRSSRQIPVYGRAEGGNNGVLVLDGRATEYVAAFSSLESVPDAYAVYVAGTSMEPRYYAGELVQVHPSRPPRRGDFVVAQVRGKGDMVEAYVKRYVGRSDTQLLLEQFNPPGPVAFDLADVLAVHLVIGATTP